MITALATLTIFSCQKDDELETTNTQTSMVDPNTPKDARPYFADEILSNGKTSEFLK